MTLRLWNMRKQRFLARSDRVLDTETHFVQATISAAHQSARVGDSFPPIGVALARQHWARFARPSHRPAMSSVAIISAVLGVASLGVAGAVPAPVQEAVSLMARGFGVELPPRRALGESSVEAGRTESNESKVEPATSTTLGAPAGTSGETTTVKPSTTSSPTTESPTTSDLTSTTESGTTTSTTAAPTTTTAPTTTSEPSTTTTEAPSSSPRGGDDGAARTEGGGGDTGESSTSEPGDPQDAAGNDGAGGDASEGASDDGSPPAASEEPKPFDIMRQLQPLMAAFIPRFRGLLAQLQDARK